MRMTESTTESGCSRLVKAETLSSDLVCVNLEITTCLVTHKVLEGSHSTEACDGVHTPQRLVTGIKRKPPSPPSAVLNTGPKQLTLVQTFLPGVERIHSQQVFSHQVFSNRCSLNRCSANRCSASRCSSNRSSLTGVQSAGVHSTGVLQ
ncbi:hypothetical protein ACOMHN_010273 [Nucella lapillus]